MSDPEIIPLPTRIVDDGFGNPVAQQRWMFCPGTLDSMEAQFEEES